MFRSLTRKGQGGDMVKTDKKPQVIQTRNGGFRVLNSRRVPERISLPPRRCLTAEEIWLARCDARRTKFATALKEAEEACPAGARIVPMYSPQRFLFAVVDESDHAWLSRYEWQAWTRRGYKNARAVAMIDGRLEQMARLVMGVGHRYRHVVAVNGNLLDCRRSNLKVIRPHAECAKNVCQLGARPLRLPCAL